MGWKFWTWVIMFVWFPWGEAGPSDWWQPALPAEAVAMKKVPMLAVADSGDGRAGP